MKVLIVNAGSSSLKYQLVDMDNEQMIVKGQVERIAIEGSHLNQKTPDLILNYGSGDVKIFENVWVREHYLSGKLDGEIMMLTASRYMVNQNWK